MGGDREARPREVESGKETFIMASSVVEGRLFIIHPQALSSFTFGAPHPGPCRQAVARLEPRRVKDVVRG